MHMLSMTMKLDLDDMVHVYLWMTIAECVHEMQARFIIVLAQATV